MNEVEYRYKVKFSIREAVGWETKVEKFETKDDAKAFAKSILSNRNYAAICITDMDDNPIEARYKQWRE